LPGGLAFLGQTRLASGVGVFRPAHSNAFNDYLSLMIPCMLIFFELQEKLTAQLFN
jgi:hypothetical protein